MTAPADCLVSAKVLFSDHTFFSPSFFLFIINNCNYGSLERNYKNEDLTVMYSKINMNVVKIISPRQ